MTPVPVRSVAMRGQMTPSGYLPENHEWRDTLTEVVSGRRQGKDPMSLPTAILTAAGHGPRRTRDVVAALGDVPLNCEVRAHKDLRGHCLGCQENAAEVRRCTIINCPLWPYRMGRNPHNPRRGRNPFAKAD